MFLTFGSQNRQFNKIQNHMQPNIRQAPLNQCTFYQRLINYGRLLAEFAKLTDHFEPEKTSYLDLTYTFLDNMSVGHDEMLDKDLKKNCSSCKVILDGQYIRPSKELVSLPLKQVMTQFIQLFLKFRTLAQHEGRLCSSLSTEVMKVNKDLLQKIQLSNNKDRTNNLSIKTNAQGSIFKPFKQKPNLDYLNPINQKKCIFYCSLSNFAVQVSIFEKDLNKTQTLSQKPFYQLLGLLRKSYKKFQGRLLNVCKTCSNKINEKLPSRIQRKLKVMSQNQRNADTLPLNDTFQILIEIKNEIRELILSIEEDKIICENYQNFAQILKKLSLIKFIFLNQNDQIRYDMEIQQNDSSDEQIDFFMQEPNEQINLKKKCGFFKQLIILEQMLYRLKKLKPLKEKNSQSIIQNYTLSIIKEYSRFERFPSEICHFCTKNLNENFVQNSFSMSKEVGTKNQKIIVKFQEIIFRQNLQKTIKSIEKERFLCENYSNIIEVSKAFEELRDKSYAVEIPWKLTLQAYEKQKESKWPSKKSRKE